MLQSFCTLTRANTQPFAFMSGASNILKLMGLLACMLKKDYTIVSYAVTKAFCFASTETIMSVCYIYIYTVVVIEGGLSSTGLSPLLIEKILG